MNSQSTEDFQVCENTPPDIKMMDTSHYTLGQINRANTESESECKLWTLGDNVVLLQVHQL